MHRRAAAVARAAPAGRFPALKMAGGTVGFQQITMHDPSRETTGLALRHRQEGEAVAIRKFCSRIGFAWRRLCCEAPYDSGHVGACMEQLLRLANTLSRQAIGSNTEQKPRVEAQNGGVLRGPPGLEPACSQSIDAVEECAMNVSNCGVQTCLDLSSEQPQPIGAVEKCAMNVSECETRTCLDLASDQSTRFDPQPRKLRAHCSDESTCMWGSTVSTCEEEELERTVDENSSIASTEDWQPMRCRSHSHRPRRGRRGKARARRELWEETKAQSCRETMHDASGDFVGALLACIAEDESGGVSCDTSYSASDQGEMEASDTSMGRETEEGLGTLRAAKKLKMNGGCDSDQADERHVSDVHEHARHESIDQADVAEPLDVEQESTAGSVDGGENMRASNRDSLCGSESESDDKSTVSEQSAEGINEYLEKHERLGGLEQGVALLPPKLVKTFLSIQEKAEKWDRYKDGDDDDDGKPLFVISECFQGLRELKRELEKCMSQFRKLEAQWDVPSYMRSQWNDLVEWALEGDGGPIYQIGRLKDTLEEAKEEKDKELQEEWMNEELAARCYSVRESWRDYEVALEALEKAAVRHLYLQRCAEEEATNTQAMLNARLARSLGCRSGVTTPG